MSKPTTAKMSKKSHIVRLRLSPKHLSAFPTNVTPPSATPSIIKPSPPTHDAAEKTSESTGTPVPPTVPAETTDNGTLAPPKIDRRRRGGAGVSGRKRAPPTIDPNGPMRERGRPGPKKKPRLPDGTIDHSQDGTTKRAAANPTASHRLGPKANAGTINANLRALDRSGKPCRRWERKPLAIKSFTGVMWGVGQWRAPPKDLFPGDVKSDSTGSSDVKPADSSALPSERSNSGADAVMVNGIESSPVPAVLA